MINVDKKMHKRKRNVEIPTVLILQRNNGLCLSVIPRFLFNHSDAHGSSTCIIAKFHYWKLGKILFSWYLRILILLFVCINVCDNQYIRVLIVLEENNLRYADLGQKYAQKLWRETCLIFCKCNSIINCKEGMTSS